MVDNLEDFFGGLLARAEAVIDTGHGIEENESGAEDGAADDTIDVAVNGGENHAEDECGDAKRSADNMGDHIEDFFALSVVGKFAVS